jgi:hypothetical protein
VTTWTDEDLLQEFNRLNKKYFEGSLSVVYVRFERIARKGCIGHTKAFRQTGARANDKYAIKISPEIQHMRSFWMGTLIHEMVHVEQRNRYSCGLGRKFNARMKQLAAAGAMDGFW